MVVVSDEEVKRIGESLRDVNRPLKDRFRALFTLRNIQHEKCIAEISECFNDSSALLKHELAYCLGQMQDVRANPVLINVLENENQEIIVRHEAGEALGAIGSVDVLPVLEKYSKHTATEIAETCQLAIERINWLRNINSTNNSTNPYKSVDPAPAMDKSNVEELTAILLDEKISLFERYRAMFTLRNQGGEEEVLALSKGLKCSSALFRHEIAFVLGQMSHTSSIPALKDALENTTEHEMVRHECAEALGSIATDECYDIIRNYQYDKKQVVRESCDIALDMCDYENSDQFQYADGLKKP